MRTALRPAAAAVVAAAIGIGVPALAVPVAHAEDLAPDLVISTLPTASPKPGEVYDQSVTLTNEGTAPADGVTFRIRLSRGLDFPQPVEGCTYSTVADHVRQALCELDTVVRPHASITTPVRFKALPQALMEAVEYGTSSTGEVPGEGFGDSYRRLTLTSDSTADLRAEGDLTEGAPGSRVSVTATLRNDGPGWIQNQESDDQPALIVQIPPGTVAKEVPEDCRPFGTDGPTGPSQPGRPRYVCWPADHAIDVDQSLDYTFVLEIGKTARSTKGKVTASSVYGIHPEFDENRANDTAYLTVDVSGDDPGTSTSGGTTAGGTSTSSGGASSGGDTGSGGSTTDGRGNDPHDQSTGGSGATGTSGDTGASGTAASGTSGSATTATASGSATGGTLAGTGSDGTPVLTAAAVGATVLGGLVMVAVRRRGTGK